MTLQHVSTVYSFPDVFKNWSSGFEAKSTWILVFFVSSATCHLILNSPNLTFYIKFYIACMHTISTNNKKSVCSTNETLYVRDFHIKSAFCLCLVLSINIKVKLKVDR